jgi:DNA-binding NtrC family response regulator
VCRETVEYIVEILSKNPKTCAIVDQEEEYCEHLSKVLNDLGFGTFVFIGHEEFSDKCCDYNFDVVIVSWDSEDFMGEDVVESITECGEPYPSIIIGCDRGKTLSFQSSLQPIGFLFKPFDAKHFMGIIKRAIGE